MTVAQLFPFQAGGAAEDAAHLLGDRAGLCVTDRTHWSRFGLKGPGSADWLSDEGILLPDFNRFDTDRGLTVLRLGGNDIAFLGEAAQSDEIAALRARWGAASGPKGYSSWREEGWAWLNLDGPALEYALARCCAVDLRPGRFDPDTIAQTRFAHVDAVVMRRDGAAEILFDIAASATVLRTIRESGDVQ